ncbi:hypothetical protein QBZ16_003907 [Prototheca wickerhamii]|uniref:BFN domain-containing protein n=1 Tax=Prototheca wickerhamii TaxID=3111 RepID=A0AAD9IJ13_PROWI|nr:hypothetical protein QBZ16_003907 [Prototheca wickerhamii]
MTSFQLLPRSLINTDDHQAVVDLRLKDGKGSILKIFIGRSEAESMRHARGEITMSRPNTHDAMAELMKLLKCRVTRVCITELRRLTYYARMFLLLDRSVWEGGEISMDIRPSDALGVALRLGAGIYVDKGVARAMAKPPEQRFPALPPPAPPATPAHPTAALPGVTHMLALPLGPLSDSQKRIVQSCQEEAARFVDPTTFHCLLLQLAVAEQRYGDAVKLQSVIARRFATHSGARALVAMQAALSDGRFEEAVFHRDELRQNRLRDFQRSATGMIDPEDDAHIASDSAFE